MKTNPMFCTNDIGVATNVIPLKIQQHVGSNTWNAKVHSKNISPQIPSLHMKNQDFSKKMDPNLTRISDFCPTSAQIQAIVDTTQCIFGT